MFKNFWMLAAVVGLAACTSTTKYPNQAYNSTERNPAGLAEISQQSMASVQNIPRIVATSFRQLSTGAHLVSESLSNLPKEGWNFSVAGIHASKDFSVMVFEDSRKLVRQSVKDSKEALAKGSQFIVTHSGSVLEFSREQSKELFALSENGIKVSVKVSQDISGEVRKGVIEIYNISSQVLLGSATVSEEVLAKVREGATFVLTASGQLMIDSKDFSVQVFDQAGKLVGFVVDHTGAILKWSSNSTMFIVTGVGKGMQEMASTMYQELRDSVRSGAKYSVMLSRKAGEDSKAILLHFSGKSQELVETSSFNSLQQIRL